MNQTNTIPALFVSHGSPMMAIEPSPTHTFLQTLGQGLPTPRAIVVASAHFMARTPVVTAVPMPETIHDFGGFPEPLYRIQYPAPGSPELAAEIAGRLRAAGLEAQMESRHGLDHGVWVPLRLMYPQADIPVIALSVNPFESAQWHYRIGQALAPLREEGVLVIGSGGFSHNLRALDWHDMDAAEPDWVIAFTDTLRRKLLDGDINGALDWRALPEASRNHPTPEHLYPLYVAWGAGGEETRARLLHQAVQMGAMALDAFAFGANA